MPNALSAVAGECRGADLAGAELADRAYRPGLAQRTGSGAWQHPAGGPHRGVARLAAAPGEPVRSTPVTLKIWIAGQSDPVQVGLYQDDGKFAALLPSSTWLSLSQAQYRDLMRPIP